MKGLAGLILVLAAAVGALWFFGQSQPIVVVERSAVGKTTVPCTACFGTKMARCEACGGIGGRSGESHVCAVCGGSGRSGYSGLKNTQTRVKRMGVEMACVPCRGTGQQSGPRDRCEACSGSGWVSCPSCEGTGLDTQASTTHWKTVRADYSLWERALAVARMTPDDNAAPEVRADGSVPLAAAYLELFQTPNRRADGVDWMPVSPAEQGWTVTALVRLTEGASRRDAGRLFVIQGREVVDCRPVSWPMPAAPATP